MFDHCFYTSKYLNFQSELRKILTEMGAEPFEPEEADEVISDITFDEHDLISQDGT